MNKNISRYFRSLGQGTLVFLLLSFVVSCKKGDKLPNAAPDTKISFESINLTGENRLNSTVNLSWFGTDIDGFIVNYQIKINDGDWVSTTTQDSTFLFEISPNEDSTDIEFYVRAIDNEGLADPTPAFLKVPLKNSPPVVSFDEESLPIDTTNLVITFRYTTSDPDGDNTLQKVFIRANSGSWKEISLAQRLISIIPKNTTAQGQGLAEVYYGTSSNPSFELDGYVNNGINIIQLKVTDIANSESKIDSTLPIYVKPQTSDLLVISGNNISVETKYKVLVNANYTNADYINYAANGGLNQPRFWDPSFRLLALKYDKVFFHTDEGNFSNPLTGADGTLLDFASPIIQTLIDNNKKVLVSTAFATGIDLSTIGGVLSIDSLTSSKGQAFFTNDSFATSPILGYPSLQPNNFLLATDPFYPALDAEVLYKAQLTPSGGWKGPRTIAIQRKNQNNKVNLVVFTVPFHLLNKNTVNQNQVLNKILNEAFNW